MGVNKNPQTAHAEETGRCVEKRQVFYNGDTLFAISIGDHLAMATPCWGNYSGTNKVCGSSGPAEAISTCASATLAGKTWRLPTKEEMEAAYEIAESIMGTQKERGRISTTYTWTSSRAGNGNYYYAGIDAFQVARHGGPVWTTEGNYNAAFSCVFEY